MMEGSLRQAGVKLRLAVQLVDAVSGAHLWAETYDRPFSPEAVFELQDDLVPRIVSTVADMNGVLPRSMSEAVRSRAPEQLSPYEAVLRSFRYFERVTAEELAAARSGLELAVREGAGLCRCLGHAGVAVRPGLRARIQPSGGFPDERVNRGAARRRDRAIQSLWPISAWPRRSSSKRNSRAFVTRRIGPSRSTPMDGNSIAFLGELLTYAGDSERGLALADARQAAQSQSSRMVLVCRLLQRVPPGRLPRRARISSLKANLPGHWGMHAAMAAAYGQLGERDAAAKALRDLLKLRPDFARTARNGHREVVGARVRGAPDRRLAQGGAGDRRRRSRRRRARTLGVAAARAPLAPTKGSGSRCCPFKYAAPTAELERPWPMDCPRRSSPVCRASPTSE